MQTIKYILFFLVTLSTNGICQLGFFSPVDNSVSVKSETNQKWEFRPVVGLSGLQLTPSNKDNTFLESNLIGAVGSGITYSHLYKNGDEWKSDIGFSAILLMDVVPEGINVHIGGSVNLLDNRFLIGGAYNIGTVFEDDSRFSILLKYGIDFNN